MRYFICHLNIIFRRGVSNLCDGKVIKHSRLPSQVTWCHWWWLFAASRVPPTEVEWYQSIDSGAQRYWCSADLLRCFTCYLKMMLRRYESNLCVGIGKIHSMLVFQATWCIWNWMFAVSGVPPVVEEWYQSVVSGAQRQCCSADLMWSSTRH